MGMDMVAVDVLSTFQVEPQDYVQFQTSDGIHSGMVLDVEDNGDTFTITLSDDEEGDSVPYMVNADAKILLLAYESVAV